LCQRNRLGNGKEDEMTLFGWTLVKKEELDAMRRTVIYMEGELKTLLAEVGKFPARDSRGRFVKRER
jgi:hypothetical protein